MSQSTAAPLAALRNLHQLHESLFGAARALIGGSALGLLARLTLAGVFWRSLLTKVETYGVFKYTEYINDFPVDRAAMKLPHFPLQMRDTTYFQFENDFALPLIPGPVAAWAATLAEFALPLLLVLGLLTRLSAAALLAMTLVIQIFVFGDDFFALVRGEFWTSWWGTHALWTCLCVYLIAYGPGRFSLDTASARFFAR
jgi:putative oxidoreductase